MDTVGGEATVGYETQDDVDCLRDDVGVVAIGAIIAEAEEVAACVDGLEDDGFEVVVVDYGAHSEVVGNDDAVEAHLIAKQTRYGGLRERGGPERVDAAVDDMSHHDGGHLFVGHEDAIGSEFVGLPCAANVDKTFVGIGGGGAVAGKMFQATNHSMSAKLLQPDATAGSHLVGIGRETAFEFSDDGASRIDIDIGHGCIVEVDAGALEHLRRQSGIVPHAVGAAESRLPWRRDARKSVDGTHATHLATLLVDAYEQWLTGRELL